MDSLLAVLNQLQAEYDRCADSFKPGIMRAIEIIEKQLEDENDV